LTRLSYAPRALGDLERLADFLREESPTAAAATAGILLDGLNILRRHPLVGRAVESNLRELVISRGHSGFVALYRYDVETDAALVLAVRHQREGGYDPR